MGLAIVGSEGLVFEGCKQLDPEGFLGLLVEQAHPERYFQIGVNNRYNGSLLKRFVRIESLRELKVASLNYAGISHNPFEFYSGTSEQRV